MFVPLQLLFLVRIIKAISTHKALYLLPSRALGFDFCTVDVYVDADESSSSSDIQLTINSVFGLSYSRLNTVYVCCSNASAEAFDACKPEADQLQIHSNISEDIFDALNPIKKDKSTFSKKKVVITGSIGLVGSFLSEIR